MAAEKGSAFLVKIGDGATPTEAFTTVAAMRTTSMSINAEAIDVTTKDSAGWRTLLAGAGTKSVSVSGAGVFTDDASQVSVQTDMLAQTLRNFELVFESGDKFAGAFKITSLEYAGDFNGERTYSLSLESSGAIAFTAA